MSRRMASIFISAILVGGALATAPQALADHTDPRAELSPTEGPSGVEGVTRGEGSWHHFRQFPPNPGTDVMIFRKGGKRSRKIFGSSGTLGQGEAGHVGQRMIQLTNAKGKVNPRWRADHGSAACETSNPSGVTGLQHDQTVTPKKNPRLMIDTTDATGRCHDPAGSGLELFSITKLHKKGFGPKEVHLTRHQGGSHTVTRDATRPWIIYNNNSQFSGMPWIDVLNIKSCLNRKHITIAKKRKGCRPKVYRINFHPDWSRQAAPDGTLVEGSEAACHDINAYKNRIYCAGLNATLIFDVKNLTTASGKVRGKPLPCKVVGGTDTKAKVTDCNDLGEGSTPQARGWRFLGTVNHAGRNGSHNTNTDERSDENIAVSHESPVTPDRKWMFVTDERGGGVVPGGASCSPGVENPYGNGGVHVFDIRNPSNIKPARTKDGSRAVFIGEPTVASPTFCTAHRMELVPGEQRFFIAWYSQGIKVVDWWVDGQGRWTFRETASIVLPGAQTWTAAPFKIVKHKNGTKSYHLMAGDIERGIDILRFRMKPNRIGSLPPETGP